MDAASFVGAATEPPRILPDHVTIDYGPILGHHASCACGQVEILGEREQRLLDNSMLMRASSWAFSHPCTWRAKC